MHPGEHLIQLIDDLAAQPAEGPRVSLYQPTSPEPDRMKENEIRLKDQVKTLSRRLQAMDIDSSEAEALRDRIFDAAADWRDGTRLREGLALFAASGLLQQAPLPQSVPEGVFASERFHLKPLFSALQQNRPYYVLALSQNEAALFEGNALGLRRLKTDDAWPDSLKSVAGHEPSGKALHYHAGDRGGESAIFHGRGAGKDDVQPEIDRFLEAVDKALGQLPLIDGAPVVLAGVSDLLASFRRNSGCDRLAERQVEGNVEHFSEQELHRSAWPVVQQQLEDECAEALQALENGDPDIPVARQLSDVLRAAVGGRVDTVFVAGDRERWGRMDGTGQELEQHEEYQPGDYDLVDRAAVESHLRGAEVYVVPGDGLPGQGLALARLRY